jgi:hypothetical protein
MRNVKWSIWPVKPLRGTVHVGVAIDEWLDGLARSRESLKRARCIGEGHVRARARMARFVAWLEEMPACGERSEVIYETVCCMSPELAVRLVPSWCTVRWLSMRVEFKWWRRMCDVLSEPVAAAEAVRDAMLASPEWASLPWQRDPEVSRG